MPPSLLSPDRFAWYWYLVLRFYISPNIVNRCIDASSNSRARVIVRKTGSKLVEIQIEGNYIGSPLPVHFLPFLRRYVRFDLSRIVEPFVYCVFSRIYCVSYNYSSPFLAYLSRGRKKSKYRLFSVFRFHTSLHCYDRLLRVWYAYLAIRVERKLRTVACLLWSTSRSRLPVYLYLALILVAPITMDLVCTPVM